MNNNTYLFALLGVALLIGVGAFAYVNSTRTATVPVDSNQVSIQQEASPATNNTQNTTAGQNQDTTTQTSPQPSNEAYVSYSSDYLSRYQGKTKILFFHASWCPTCKAAENDIKNKLDQIPENVVIIKTDYDTQSDLKKKYGITYQHTFVVVDDQGNELEKWNGGNLAEILERI